MDHIHNEAVLAFLKTHRGHPNVQRFLARKKQQIEGMNKSVGTDYVDYLEYLEDNIGDDADFTIEELQALLRPRFEVNLCENERSDYGCDGFDVCLDDLIRPVYIENEGSFFTVWDKNGRVGIPARLLKEFVAFLKTNGVKCKSEYDP